MSHPPSASLDNQQKVKKQRKKTRDDVIPPDINDDEDSYQQRRDELFNREKHKCEKLFNSINAQSLRQIHQSWTLVYINNKDRFTVLFTQNLTGEDADARLKDLFESATVTLILQAVTKVVEYMVNREFEEVFEFLQKIAQVHHNLEVELTDVQLSNRILIRAIKKSLGAGFTKEMKKSWSYFTPFMQACMCVETAVKGKLDCQIPERDFQIVRDTWEHIEFNRKGCVNVWHEQLMLSEPQMRKYFPYPDRLDVVLTGLERIISLTADTDVLLEYFAHLGKKHVENGIKKRSLKKFGRSFFLMVSHAIGDRFDSETQAAWTSVWSFLLAQLKYGISMAEMSQVPSDPDPIGMFVTINHVDQIQPVEASFFADVEWVISTDEHGTINDSVFSKYNEQMKSTLNDDDDEDDEDDDEDEGGEQEEEDSELRSELSTKEDDNNHQQSPSYEASFGEGSSSIKLLEQLKAKTTPNGRYLKPKKKKTKLTKQNHNKNNKNNKNNNDINQHLEAPSWNVQISNTLDVEDLMKQRDEITSLNIDDVWYQRGHLRGIFFQYFDMHDYPFDRHLLNLKFILNGVNIKAAKFDRDRIIVELGHTNAISLGGTEWDVFQPNHIVKTKRNHTTHTNHSELTMFIPIVRKWKHMLIHALFPLSIIDVISFLVYSISPGRLFYRMQLFTALLLTLFAFNFTVMESLPPVPYLTLMDYNMKCSFLFLALHCTAATIVSKITNHDDRRNSDTIFFGILLSSFVLIKSILGYLSWKCVNRLGMGSTLGGNNNNAMGLGCGMCCFSKNNSTNNKNNKSGGNKNNNNNGGVQFKDLTLSRTMETMESSMTADSQGSEAFSISR